MTRHLARSNSRSPDQPDQRTADPINERTSCDGSHGIPLGGWGKAAANALQAISASATCPHLSAPLAFASPVTNASQRSSPLPDPANPGQSKCTDGNGSPSMSKRARICLRIQAVSVKPVARTLAPAPADHALPPSTTRPAVSPEGSSGTGTQRGHSKPSATCVPDLRLPTTSSTSPSILCPSRWVAPWRTAHPKLPFLTEPMSAQ